ncbi:beta-lactamase/transpeptidase-like protein [Mollisia scopiformis]|uniref:Beta-lactamase/transpeptidase-like protein n=1 Tax=Mollisia scopiformis TaxID=149040 RepID=A0A194XRS0_MOLSC|nr:beta-lactamase/transpeptidase-like protein [Mollisia scopiformis]KUJ22846.1 beta-lactamase/transpeptidase-like protein [Mollisia scopiformis]
MVSKIFGSCLLGFLFTNTALAATNCPLLGPDFPAPKNLSSSQTFQAALTNLTQLLLQSISSGNTTYGPLDAVKTSFSIEMFSIHEERSLFSSQFSAPALATVPYGVKNVTADTMFRIGSSTKLISAYTFLIQAGDRKWNDPVTKYVPELLEAAEALNATQDSIDYVAWEDVTLWELASHMAGVGRDYAGFGELDGLLDPAPDPTALGLPPLNATEVATCAGGSMCSRAQFFAGFTERHPVFAPSTSPVYSNAALQIFAYALENITGIDMPTMVSNSLITPLNLTHSSWTVPTSNASGVLPEGNSWSLDLGDETAAGGMYSSTSDMTKIARSILTSSLISPAQTRRWMKPRSLLSAGNAAVGAPWEIYRLELSPNDRVVDIYTKSGDLPGYSSVFVLAPDFDLGFTVLTAGPSATTNSRILGGLISDAVFQAVEDAAREEAEANYVGTYEAANKSLKSTITITIDPMKPGLGVTSWISNGTDMLSPTVEAAGIAAPSARLYPSGLKKDLGNGETEVGFRAVFENLNAGVIGGIFGSACETWFSVDSTYWGTVATDEFLVTVGEDGKAKSVSPRALRVELVKS